MALDENSETFVVHVTSLNLALALKIYLDRVAQIVFLLIKKVKISDKYTDFVNVFSQKKALVLSNRTKINEHIINLENGKQLLYKLIYSPSPVELEILKTYIKTHLKKGFIRPSKPLVSIFILFDKKLDGSFCLNIYYWDFNNLKIKNRYFLLLIKKSPDRLGQVKRFTQLDLTSTYYQIRINKDDKWKIAV